MPGQPGHASKGTTYPKEFRALVEQAYITQDFASNVELAAAFGIPIHTLSRWIYGGKWLAKRGEYQRELKRLEITEIAHSMPELNARHYAIWDEILKNVWMRVKNDPTLHQLEKLTYILEKAQAGQRLCVLANNPLPQASSVFSNMSIEDLRDFQQWRTQVLISDRNN